MRNEVVWSCHHTLYDGSCTQSLSLHFCHRKESRQPAPARPSKETQRHLLFHQLANNWGLWCSTYHSILGPVRLSFDWRLGSHGLSRAPRWNHPKHTEICDDQLLEKKTRKGSARISTEESNESFSNHPTKIVDSVTHSRANGHSESNRTWSST